MNSYLSTTHSHRLANMCSVLHRFCKQILSSVQFTLLTLLTLLVCQSSGFEHSRFESATRKPFNKHAKNVAWTNHRTRSGTNKKTVNVNKWWACHVRQKESTFFAHFRAIWCKRSFQHGSGLTLYFHPTWTILKGVRKITDRIKLRSQPTDKLT